MGVEEVGINGLGKIVETGIVGIFSAVIIAGMGWAIKVLVTQLKELTGKYLTSLEDHGKQYADVINNNTKAMVELRETIKDVARS